MRKLLLIVIVLGTIALAQFPGMPRRGSGGTAAAPGIASTTGITYEDVQQASRPTFCLIHDGSSTLQNLGLMAPYYQQGSYSTPFATVGDEFDSWLHHELPPPTPAVPNTGARDSSGVAGPRAYQSGTNFGLDGWAFFAQWGISPGTTEKRHSYFVGMRTNADGGMNRRKPNALFDSVYVGCHQGDTAQSICTNGVNDAGATCVYLGLADGGGDFPCNTVFVGNVLFKMNQGGTSLQYAVQNIRTGTMMTGTRTTNLPRPQALLGWELAMLTDAGSTASRMGFSVVCTGEGVLQ